MILQKHHIFTPSATNNIQSEKRQLHRSHIASTHHYRAIAAPALGAIAEMKSDKPDASGRCTAHLPDYVTER